MFLLLLVETNFHFQPNALNMANADSWLMNNKHGIRKAMNSSYTTTESRRNAETEQGRLERGATRGSDASFPLVSECLLVGFVRANAALGLIPNRLVILHGCYLRNTHDGRACHHGGQYSGFDVTHGISPLVRDFRVDHPLGTCSPGQSRNRT